MSKQKEGKYQNQLKTSLHLDDLGLKGSFKGKGREGDSKWLTEEQANREQVVKSIEVEQLKLVSEGAEDAGKAEAKKKAEAAEKAKKEAAAAELLAKKEREEAAEARKKAEEEEKQALEAEAKALEKKKKAEEADKKKAEDKK